MNIKESMLERISDEMQDVCNKLCNVEQILIECQQEDDIEDLKYELEKALEGVQDLLWELG